MGIEFNQNEIDCSGYIGKSFIDKKKKKKVRLILLNSGYGNLENPFKKHDQETIQVDKKNQVPISIFLWIKLKVVKRSVIISYKHGVYESSHELLKKLRKLESIMKLGNY